MDELYELGARAILVTEHPRMPVVSEEPFRPFRARRVAIGFALAQAAVLVALAALTPGDGPLPWHWYDRFGLVLLALVIGYVLLLFARLRATPGPDGLVVRNVVNVTRLAWPQIVAVRFGGGDPWVDARPRRRRRPRRDGDPARGRRPRGRRGAQARHPGGRAQPHPGRRLRRGSARGREALRRRGLRHEVAHLLRRRDPGGELRAVDEDGRRRRVLL